MMLREMIVVYSEYHALHNPNTLSWQIEDIRDNEVGSAGRNISSASHPSQQQI
jgi:hypothetical protein